MTEQKLTTQRAYEIMRRHALLRPEQCSDGGGGCVYWREDGHRCFVGAVLPEDIAKELASGQAINVLDVFHPDCDQPGAKRAASYLSECHPGFLDEAQDIHDRGNGNDAEERWVRDLDDLADRLGLEPV